MAYRHGVRPETHDLTYFAPAVELASTQNAFRDVHGYELHERLGLNQLPIVLGAFSSNALLKADNIPPQLQRAVARGRRANQPVEVQELTGVRRELLVAAGQRRALHRQLLLELRPESADEWRYIWPFTMRSYAANLHSNRRLFRTHEPFMSNDVVKLAAAVPQRWKAQRQLFRKALRPWLQPAWYIPHTRNRFPYFGTGVNSIARPLLGLVRDGRALLTGQWRANHESWPVWESVVRSDLMSARLLEYPIEDSAIRSVFLQGTDMARAVRNWTALRHSTALQLGVLYTMKIAIHADGPSIRGNEKQVLTVARELAQARP